MASKLTGCDNKEVNQAPNYKPYVPPPPPCSGKTCPNGYYLYETNCTCYLDGTGPESPILIDVDGSGFNLTDWQNGVKFDIRNDGERIQISWTMANSTNAFLALDRDGNGTIDNGAELFGNVTPQPPSKTPNGFLALAVFDDPANGGNGDGVIDANDAIWPKLRLWQDKNHDGISQPEELFTLEQMGVRWISLHYTEVRRRDRFGNLFRYRAPIGDHIDDGMGRWAWDVFLTTPPPDANPVDAVPLCERGCQ